MKKALSIAGAMALAAAGGIAAKDFVPKNCHVLGIYYAPLRDSLPVYKTVRCEEGTSQNAVERNYTVKLTDEQAKAWRETEGVPVGGK